MSDQIIVHDEAGSCPSLMSDDLVAGLATWNIRDHHVDLEAELTVITDCAPPGEEARGGEIMKEPHGLATSRRFMDSHLSFFKASSHLVSKKWKWNSPNFCYFCLNHSMLYCSSKAGIKCKARYWMAVP